MIRDRNKGSFFYYRKPGHWANDCPSLKKKKETEDFSSFTIEDEKGISGDDLLIAVAS